MVIGNVIQNIVIMTCNRSAMITDTLINTIDVGDVYVMDVRDPPQPWLLHQCILLLDIKAIDTGYGQIKVIRIDLVHKMSCYMSMLYFWWLDILKTCWQCYVAYNLVFVVVAGVNKIRLIKWLDQIDWLIYCKRPKLLL